MISTSRSRVSDGFFGPNYVELELGVTVLIFGEVSAAIGKYARSE